MSKTSNKGAEEEEKEGEKGRCINCGKETNKHFVKVGKANENTVQNTTTSNEVVGQKRKRAEHLRA